MPEYHGWTHARKEDGGTDPIPFPPSGETPWILLDNGGQTLPGDNGFDPMIFDTLYWDPSLVTLNPADPTDGSDPHFGISSHTFGGLDYFAFYSKNGGWFGFDIFIELGNASGGAAGGKGELSMTASTFSGIPVQGYRRMGFVADWDGDSWLDNRNSIHIGERKMYTSNQQAEYHPNVRQNTGSDKDLGGMMFVAYYGGLGGSTASADWEFANP